MRVTSALVLAALRDSGAYDLLSELRGRGPEMACEVDEVFRALRVAAELVESRSDAGRERLSAVANG
jgi:hypothetical protein